MEQDREGGRAQGGCLGDDSVRWQLAMGVLGSTSRVFEQIWVEEDLNAMGVSLTNNKGW